MVFRKRSNKSDIRNLPEGVEYAENVRPLVNKTGRFGPNGLLTAKSQRKTHQRSGIDRSQNYETPEVPPPQRWKNEMMREKPTSSSSLMRMLRDKLTGFRDKKLSWSRSNIDAPGTWFEGESVPVDGYTAPPKRYSRR